VISLPLWAVIICALVYWAVIIYALFQCAVIIGALVYWIYWARKLYWGGFKRWVGGCRVGRRNRLKG
jgi:hypothetical protein